MSRLDQFESVFKAASKAVFHYHSITFGKALIISDLEEYQAKLFGDRVRAFLSGIDGAADTDWREFSAGAIGSVGDVLRLVETERPDLVCTYRNLYSGAWQWPFTLGDHLEVLTQVTDVPVLVLPRLDDGVWESGVQNTDRVMALTDHLTGDDGLVNMAVSMTSDDGVLFLAHVEDGATFDRYMDAIGRCANIDSEVARHDIHEQLLKAPHDFIQSCRQKLADVPITVEERVTGGHRLSIFKELIEAQDLDLLVMHTKDDDQLAMHGLAYPLAVELRSVPMLLL